MAESSQYFILQLVAGLYFLAEQICFGLYAKYPYRWGLSVFSCTIPQHKLGKSAAIGDQLRSIALLLNYDYAHRFRSQSIYIRREASFLRPACYSFCADISFKSQWKATIHFGPSWIILLIYILVFVSIMDPPPHFRVLAVVVIGAYVLFEVFDYFRLRRYLVKRLGG